MRINIAVVAFMLASCGQQTAGPPTREQAKSARAEMRRSLPEWSMLGPVPTPQGPAYRAGRAEGDGTVRIARDGDARNDAIVGDRCPAMALIDQGAFETMRMEIPSLARAWCSPGRERFRMTRAEALAGAERKTRETRARTMQDVTDATRPLPGVRKR